MSTSCAPRSTTSWISASRSERSEAGRERAGDARDLHARTLQLRERDRHQVRVQADGRDRRDRRIAGGRTAFAHIAMTLPTVSVPSSVVRSMHRIARSSAHSFDSRLIERFASEDARSRARRRPPRARGRAASRRPSARTAPDRGGERSISAAWDIARHGTSLTHVLLGPVPPRRFLPHHRGMLVREFDAFGRSPAPAVRHGAPRDRPFREGGV